MVVVLTHLFLHFALCELLLLLQKAKNANYYVVERCIINEKMRKASTRRECLEAQIWHHSSTLAKKDRPSKDNYNDV